jgi:hypothetical protein
MSVPSSPAAAGTLSDPLARVPGFAVTLPTESSLDCPKAGAASATVAATIAGQDRRSIPSRMSRSSTLTEPGRRG